MRTPGKLHAVHAVYLQCVLCLCLSCRADDYDWKELADPDDDDEIKPERREIKIEDTFLEHNNKYFELRDRRLLFQVVAVRGDSEAQRAADMQQVLGMRVLGKGDGLDWVVWDFKKLQSKLEYKAIHHPLVEEVRDTASFKAERELSAAPAPAPAGGEGEGEGASAAGASGE